jgi:hypothetical protein
MFYVHFSHTSTHVYLRVPVKSRDAIQRLKLVEKYTIERYGSSLPASYKKYMEFLGSFPHPLQRKGIQLWDSSGSYLEEHYSEDILTIQKHRLLEIREYGGPLSGSAGKIYASALYEGLSTRNVHLLI